MAVNRILLLADTHLGFDLPSRPRVTRRLRGHDFFENYERALYPALHGQVDCVVHGGDLLFRSKVSAGLVQRALAPLKEVASRGIPVLLVPGNHERSQIPFGLLTQHPNLYIFDRPRTFLLEVGENRLAFSGFPFVRNEVRRNFKKIVNETGWRSVNADIRFLCLHQCVEGARVGPADFTFRGASDVIRCQDFPGGFVAVLAGHIHRSQVLHHDLSGRRLPAPVLYPGSVERTSFAEKDETKGYLLLTVTREGPAPVRLQWRFRTLATRSMVRLNLDVDGIEPASIEQRIRLLLHSLPVDSVVQLRVKALEQISPRVLSAAALRSLAPPTMNIILQPLH